jgi:hypothetical protein
MRGDGQSFRDHPLDHSGSKCIVLVDEERAVCHAVVRQPDVRRIDAKNDPVAPLCRPEIRKVLDLLTHRHDVTARGTLPNTGPGEIQVISAAPTQAEVDGSPTSADLEQDRHTGGSRTEVEAARVGVADRGRAGATGDP